LQVFDLLLPATTSFSSLQPVTNSAPPPFQTINSYITTAHRTIFIQIPTCKT
jgi:hypothetical protein